MPAATPRPCPALPGALSAPRAAYQRAQPAAARPARGEPRGQRRRGSGATRGCGGGSVRPGLKTQSGERGWEKPGERRRGAERGGAGPRPYPGRLRSAGGSGLPEEGGRRSGRRRARGAGRPGREGTGGDGAGLDRAWTGPAGPQRPAHGSREARAEGRRVAVLHGGLRPCIAPGGVWGRCRGGSRNGRLWVHRGCLHGSQTVPGGGHRSQIVPGEAQIPNGPWAGPSLPALCSLTGAAAEVFGWLTVGWL